MKNNIFLWLIFLLFSCDPIDERLIFISKNEGKYIQLMYFENDHFDGYIGGVSPYLIEKGNNVFPILGSWRSYAKNDNFMIIRIYDKKEFEELDSIYSSAYGKGNYIDTQIIDTLINKNKFVDKKVFFKELKKKDWQINLDN